MTGDRDHDDLLPDDPDVLTDGDLDTLYRAQPVARPPTGFADRVVPRARWRRLRWVTTGAALAAAAALLAFWIGPGQPKTGALDARSMTSVNLVDRARVVADPGARLRWAVVDEALEVQQTRGRVFYRIDEGPLTVVTPAGHIDVAGTCFTVEVEDMSPALKNLALGALAGAAVTVVVYEGAVRVANEHGAVRLAPGETARAVPERAPVRSDAVELEISDRRIAPPAPPAPPPAPAVAPPAPRLLGVATRVELEQLLEETQAELKRVQRELEAEQAMRTESEGRPLPFPDDLPERFAEDELRTRFQQALEETGLDGEMVSIDCSEYPCIIYADMEHSEDHAHDQLLEADAMSPYADDGRRVSVWGRVTKEADGTQQRSNFVGLALTRKGLPAEQERAVAKRVEFRNKQTFEAFRPPTGDEAQPE